MPPPIIVESGSGLHIYWPLQQTLDPETWQYYASGLKNLCHHHGLHADPTRTADISSVLRTLGTHNRKSGATRVVECDPKFLEIQPYAIERFEIFVAHAGVQRPPKPANAAPIPLGECPAHLLRTKPVAIVEAIRRMALYEPASGLPIAEQCEQVRALRDKKGCLPEPLWYAALGVLAFCQDGDELAHDWSSGYEGYTEFETQERLERLRTLTGATTCEKFHSLDPVICERCPHWQKIKTPVILGRQRATRPISDPQSFTPAGRAGPVTPAWELTAGGAIKPRSYINAAVALGQLGIRFRHDIFHNRKIIEGDVSENLGPELSDPTSRALRDLVISRFGFDPGKENIQEAAERACEANRFNPVVDYLISRKWDGQARLDRWLITYLGADDTPLNRSIGRKMLIAAVRRVRRPGCKFDFVPVLEGKQGTGKSSALRILAGEENFSDQPLLHLETRAQQEAVEGIWIFELTELAGLRRTEIETVKSFLSKTEDNARPAYGRFRSDQRRQGIFVGTTNDIEYLRDATGNRRFWPVRTGTIDLVALQVDRDQLWAEAVAAEGQGEALTLANDLYDAAVEQQEERLLKDPWDDMLAGISGTAINIDGVNMEERISSQELLSTHLRLPADKINDGASKRLRHAMARLGWRGPKKIRFEIEARNPATGKFEKTSILKQGYWRSLRA